MRGKVKFVECSLVKSTDSTIFNGEDELFTTCAVLYNGDRVSIHEDDIRACYNVSKLSNVLISELSDSLHNVWISYSVSEDGDYWLDDDLADLIQ